MHLGGDATSCADLGALPACPKSKSIATGMHAALAVLNWSPPPTIHASIASSCHLTNGRCTAAPSSKVTVHGRSYAFDRVIGEGGHPRVKMCEDHIAGVVKSVLSGINCAVFAYGALSASIYLLHRLHVCAVARVGRVGRTAHP